jgi:hypothetical protein
MPALTRWCIKTSLVYLVVGLLFGLILALEPLGWFPLPGLLPVYIHLLTVGWLTQLIFGVVYWMFPKYTMDKPRRSERQAWLVYVLLNFGVLARVIGEPLNAQYPGTAWGWLIALSALAQWLAGVLFVINTWGRVKER